jgi:hypothetical protein
MLETAGRLAGSLLAPLVAAGAAWRRSRFVHAHGLLFRAVVEPAAEGPPASALAARLAGPALVRLSSAIWDDERRPDLLGAAVRFGGGPGGEPGPRAQDLLLTTARHAWTTLPALWSTQRHDWLANEYFTMAPLRDGGWGTLHLRLVGSRGGGAGRDRDDRLVRAVEAGKASFLLEARPAVGGGRWSPVVKVVLRERDASGAAVRFDPFRAGAGLEPVGFLNALRRAAYPASRVGAPVPRP